MRELLSGEARISFHSGPKGGFVRVWHGRAANNLAELDEVMKGVDAALEESGSRAVLFDSRESGYTPQDVQDALWGWLERSELRRVATLVQSENLAVSVRMTGLVRKVPIRAFADENAARAWLTGG